MYGDIAQHLVSRVRPTGHEFTHEVHGPRGLNHMEVTCREQLMPTRFAWSGTPHGSKVVRSPTFKAMVVRMDLYPFAPHQTMPFEKCQHYCIALFFPRAPIQLAA